MGKNFFDPDQYRWREVTGEPGLSYEVRHDYTILGYDLAAGTLDMVVRWAGDGAHCPIHRHTATTTILVIEGEQHLWDLHPRMGQGVDKGFEKSFEKGVEKVRHAGDYALTVADALPHLERGGERGGVVFFGNHSSDGRLYEILDENLKVVVDVTMELLVADWNENS